MKLRPPIPPPDGPISIGQLIDTLDAEIHAARLDLIRMLLNEQPSEEAATQIKLCSGILQRVDWSTVPRTYAYLVA